MDAIFHRTSIRKYQEIPVEPEAEGVLTDL